MCASFEMNEVRLRPGARVTGWRKPKRNVTAPWIGFARSEILDWWKRHGELVDVPAERFAERSNVSGELVWRDVPEGWVIRGVVDPENDELRIVTRPANAEEMLHFQHERMPVIEKPLFSAEMPATVGLPLFEVEPRKPQAKAVQEMLL